MVFQGTKKTNKGHQLRLQTLSFDLYMKNQGRGGGYRRDHGSLSGGGERGYKRDHGSLPGGWLGHSRYHGCLPGGGGGYRRDHGSLSGGGGLQTRPSVSIGGRGATGESMGLYKGEGGAKQILWVSSRGWGAIRGGHHLHLFWWVLSLYSSFDQFPNTFLTGSGYLASARVLISLSRYLVKGKRKENVWRNLQGRGI